MKIYYNDNYTASKYAFDTTRKSMAIADSLLSNPLEHDITIVDPNEYFDTADSYIQQAHSAEYYNAVKTGTPLALAESQGFDWDKGIFTMAVSHSAGLVAATDEAIRNNTLAGSLSSGLHHANHNEGAGFCTFNGLAVAGLHAKNIGVERVLFIDFDAHCGGGTWDIMQRVLPNAVQIDVTCQAFDTYRPDGESSIWYTGHDEYRLNIDRALIYASKKLGAFDFIVYNAGMDPLNAGVSISDIMYRENAVRDFIGDTPSIFALAGGYTWGNRTMDDVANWHRITIDTWASAENKTSTML